MWWEARTIVAYALSLLALAEIIDLTIVAVAIPQIMSSIGTNIEKIAMVTTAYVVMAAVCTPMTGSFIHKFGLKNLALFSAVTFGTTSVFCGLSTSLSEMVFFRIIQGIGGACFPAMAQVYISKNFTEQEQPKLMTLYSMCVVMGPVIGPILGGILSDNLSWRWCFFINAPLCALGFILVFFFMQRQAPEKVKIDYVSFIFMACGLGCLEYFVDEGNANTWFESIEMVIIFACAITFITFFIWRGLLGKSVINFVLFKQRNFMFSCISMFLTMLILTSSMAYFPTMLQQIYGYPVDTTAYITAPRGIACLVAAPIVSVIMKKIDARIIILFGALLLAISNFVLAKFAPEINAAIIIQVVIVQGVAIMALFIPIIQIVFIDLPENLYNDASGIFNFCRCFASSIGTSIAATIMAIQQQTSFHDLSTHISPYSRGYAAWSQNLNGLPEETQISMAKMSVIAQSSIISFIDVFYICGIAIVILLWLPFILKRPKNITKFHLD